MGNEFRPPLVFFRKNPHFFLRNQIKFCFRWPYLQIIIIYFFARQWNNFCSNTWHFFPKILLNQINLATDSQISPEKNTNEKRADKIENSRFLPPIPSQNKYLPWSSIRENSGWLLKLSHLTKNRSSISYQFLKLVAFGIGF